MKLHPRTVPVQAAASKLRMYLLTFSDQHELTDVEMAQILIETAQTYMKYILRAERHPDHPDRKADEA